MKPGDDYIGTAPDGQPIPPPKVCPKCGGPTRRVGNRHHREVSCVSAETEWFAVSWHHDGGYPVPKCRWRSGVYTLTAWHSCFNPAEALS